MTLLELREWAGGWSASAILLNIENTLTNYFFILNELHGLRERLFIECPTTSLLLFFQFEYWCLTIIRTTHNFFIFVVIASPLVDVYDEEWHGGGVVAVLEGLVIDGMRTSRWWLRVTLRALCVRMCQDEYVINTPHCCGLNVSWGEHNYFLYQTENQTVF